MCKAVPKIRSAGSFRESQLMFKQGPHRLVPKLFQSLQKYRRQDILPDLMAGLTVGAIAYAVLAMAFAISSGVRPSA